MGTHLDGQREQVDLLERGDLALLDQAAELGDWRPAALALVLAAAAGTASATASAAAATATTTTTAATATAATITTESTLEVATILTIGWSCCCVRHVYDALYSRITIKKKKKNAMK